jgi:cytoskeletal protein CcmA (bactofilin family)
MTGDIVGKSQLCITGDVRMPKLYISGDLVGMHELFVTGDVGMPELILV